MKNRPSCYQTHTKRVSGSEWVEHIYVKENGFERLTSKQAFSLHLELNSFM